jgi:5-amino-6-(5-phosphoribosylamino)uracil reductase
MPQSLRDELAPRVALHLDEGDAVNLQKMLTHLRSHYRVKRLVCEGGAEVFRSFLALDLVDEICVTLCPAIFGGEKAPTLTGLPGAFLPMTIGCRLTKLETSDGECFLRYRVVR